MVSSAYCFMPPEIHAFEPSKRKFPPSATAYYHDQKGLYHDPLGKPASHDRIMEIHRHAEQELEGASAEYDRLRSVFDVIKGDERARSLV
jgi:hypothetical protein